MYATRVCSHVRAPRSAVHEGIPDKVPAADNETGTRMALENLAKLVETR